MFQTVTLLPPVPYYGAVVKHFFASFREIFLPEDFTLFASLVNERGLSEEQKMEDRSKLGSRIRLLHEALARGLQSLKEEMKEQHD